MKNKPFTRRDIPVLSLYFILYVTIALSMLIRQPFGDPPDEFNRYLIPEYIAEHGTLPNGYDEAIRIPSYGFSYAFQPILPYMIQGYCMRFVRLFTTDTDTLFYTARLTDFFFGLIMALFVWLLAGKWFQNRYSRYAFCFLVMFLPQSIFLHTYVNTDSCCMMSIAILLYGLTCCLEDHFTFRSCTILSVGIIFCALSYYNAYGYILSSILLFIAHYLSFSEGRLHVDIRNFLKKGGYICVLVLLCISWWFIRSYLLYDGDFLGLRTRDLCGALYGNENMRPGVRTTYQTAGYTVWGMLTSSDFLVLSVNSLISMYGPMTIYTSVWIYRFYKLLFGAGLLFCALVPKTVQKGSDDTGIAWKARPVLSIFFHCNMILCMILPLVLSVIYSYGTDYQPQGRYLMPMLIPLCYYCIRGMQKGVSGFCAGYSCLCKRPVNETVYNRLLTGLCVILSVMIILSVLVTVYGYAFPAWDAYGPDELHLIRQFWSADH